ncbi:MAG: hypothetical protein JNK64_13005 [Myxococcales bacterium]|nr:hypothetical protein [Myxococcales bacterium]
MWQLGGTRSGAARDTKEVAAMSGKRNRARRSTFALCGVAFVALAACKDERPPAPRWVHKAAEIDRETWGRDCGPGAVLQTTPTADVWTVPGGPGERLATVCSLEWADESHHQVESVSIHNQQDTFEPIQAEGAFRRALPVLMRELPEEVQREVKALVEMRESRKVRIRGFTIEWQYLQHATRALRSIQVNWDPQRIL